MLKVSGIYLTSGQKKPIISLTANRMETYTVKNQDNIFKDGKKGLTVNPIGKGG